MSDRARAEDEDDGILDSVRRILAQSQTEDQRPAAAEDGILHLDEGMMVDPPKREASRGRDPNETVSPPVPDPSDTRDGVVGHEAARSAGRSLASLRAASREQTATRTHRGGPTIEELVREEIRPILREWLDLNLPPLVEKLVRAEIAKISGVEN